MSRHAIDQPATDLVIEEIAKYVSEYEIHSRLAWETSHYCLLDSLGCAFEALGVPECTKLIGPIVSGTVTPLGARIPGTSYVTDPICATFGTGVLVRWVDYSDAFYAQTVIHPSDTFSGILAVADWLSRNHTDTPFIVRDVLGAAIQAYEIMGWLALENNFTRTGLDNTFLGKIALAAVVTKMLGGTHGEIANAVSNAFIDGHALSTFRRVQTGSRKSWAAADAASRGVMLAYMTVKGEMGYPSALTAKKWGFYDVLFEGKSFVFSRPLETFITENVIFKISYPAALQAQTAVEAAIQLHPQVKGRLNEIERIELWTHETCILMIDKSGALHNFADRDHCLQYMVAIGLIFGELDAHHYSDNVAADARIDTLRLKMTVTEDLRYSREYLETDKRTNANAVRVHFKDGTSTERAEVLYPLGHRARRAEATPLLLRKFERNVSRVFADKRTKTILAACAHREHLEQMPVHKFIDLIAM